MAADYRSDASTLKNGHFGGGYARFQAHHQLLPLSVIGPGKGAFDAKAEAALAGAQTA